MEQLNKVKLFNLLFDDIPINQIINEFKSNNFNFIVTPNIQHITQINRDQELFNCYRNANLTICDSKIIQLLSILLNKKINFVTPGSDLTQLIIESHINQFGTLEFRTLLR